MTLERGSYNNARPVILDCDPGHDDALAILLAAASPELKVLGITTVCGNTTISNSTRNALRLVSFANLDIPVARGAAKPLLREPSLDVPRIVHGESGLDGPEIPESPEGPLDQSATEFIATILRESDRKVTLIPTGPLTNIATLLLAYPDVKDNVEEIVLMGGALLHVGNITSAAEFNIYADPEAAKIVFGSGIPITMVGLDATMKCVVTDDIIAEIRGIGTPVPMLTADLLDFYNSTIKQHYSEPGGSLHDPLAVAVVLERTRVETRLMYVDVETHSELTRGETVGDVWGVTGHEPNVKVCLDADGDRFFKLLIARLRKKWGQK